MDYFLSSLILSHGELLEKGLDTGGREGRRAGRCGWVSARHGPPPATGAGMDPGVRPGTSRAWGIPTPGLTADHESSGNPICLNCEAMSRAPHRRWMSPPFNSNHSIATISYERPVAGFPRNGFRDVPRSV